MAEYKLHTTASQILTEFQSVHMLEVFYLCFQQRVDLTDHSLIVLIIIALKEICQRSRVLSFSHCLCMSLSLALLQPQRRSFQVKKDNAKALSILRVFPATKIQNFYGTVKGISKILKKITL